MTLTIYRPIPDLRCNPSLDSLTIEEFDESSPKIASSASPRIEEPEDSLSCWTPASERSRNPVPPNFVNMILSPQSVRRSIPLAPKYRMKIEEFEEGEEIAARVRHYRYVESTGSYQIDKRLPLETKLLRLEVLQAIQSMNKRLPDDAPLTLFLFTSSDRANAFQRPAFIQLFDDLTHTDRIAILTPDSKMTLSEMMQKFAREYGLPSTVVVTAHGREGGINFGHTRYLEEDICSDDWTSMKKDGNLIFLPCHAGKRIIPKLVSLLPRGSQKRISGCSASIFSIGNLIYDCKEHGRILVGAGPTANEYVNFKGSQPIRCEHWKDEQAHERKLAFLLQMKNWVTSSFGQLEYWSFNAFCITFGIGTEKSYSQAADLLTVQNIQFPEIIRLMARLEIMNKGADFATRRKNYETMLPISSAANPESIVADAIKLADSSRRFISKKDYLSIVYYVIGAKSEAKGDASKETPTKLRHYRTAHEWYAKSREEGLIDGLTAARMAMRKIRLASLRMPLCV